MDSDHDTASTSTSIQEELVDDETSTVLQSDHSDVMLSDQQHLDEHNYCKGIDGIPIMNITPIGTSTSNPTSVVPDTTDNLYEVKDEFPSTTKTAHNNRLDVSSELVEVKGELDCKPEIVDNVDLGTVYVHTDEQNDAVKEEAHISMGICEQHVKEDHTSGE